MLAAARMTISLLKLRIGVAISASALAGMMKNRVEAVTAPNPVGTDPPTRPTTMARARSRSNGTP